MTSDFGVRGEEPSAARESFSTETLRRATGATAHQVQYWMRRGWLQPDRVAEGSGYLCGWGFRDCVTAAILVEIVPPSGQQLRGFVSKVARALLTADLTADVLLIEPEVRAINETEIPALLSQSVNLTLLPLAHIRNRVRGALLRLEIDAGLFV